MVWTNAYLTLYHGTTLSGANNIIAQAASSGGHGIDLRLCRAAADFGQGFYVTTVLHQAEQWANHKVRNLPTHTSDYAAVLTFSMDRDRAGQLGDHLTFVMADTDFHDFVLYNRLGGATHMRGSGIPYDIVYGPVAAFPQSITYANCDQICLLSGKALTALGPPAPSVSQGNPLFP